MDDKQRVELTGLVDALFNDTGIDDMQTISTEGGILAIYDAQAAENNDFRAKVQALVKAVVAYRRLVNSLDGTCRGCGSVVGRCECAEAINLDTYLREAKEAME